VLDRIRQWLVPTDTIERHVLTAKLLGRPATVVDVGDTSRNLAVYLPGARITAVNVDAHADVVIEPGPHLLPFPDGSFEAAASLDTLEHIPRGDRQLFVTEMLRVVRQRAVLCCPLGTPARNEIEQADNAWYRRLTGVEHPWISEHLAYGPPTLHDLFGLFAVDGYTVSVRFSGDVRATSRQFRMAEASLHARRPQDIARWAGFRLTHRPDLGLTRESSEHSNRVFVIAERHA